LIDNTNMVLWCEKYAPSRLADFVLHRDLAERLQPMMHQAHFPNLLLCGAPGSGVKTLMRALLYEAFGLEALQGAVETRSSSKSGTAAASASSFKCIASRVHTEFLANQFSYETISSIAELRQHTLLNSATSKDKSATSANNNPKDTLTIDRTNHFRVIVIHQVDTLPLREQQALRRTMEKYMMNCRFILLVQQTSHLIQPLRSRCFHIRVPCVSQEEMTKLLASIVQQELVGINDAVHVPTLLKQVIPEIVAANRREGNLRQALLQLEQSVFSLIKLRKQELSCLSQPQWQTVLQESVLQKVIRACSVPALVDTRKPVAELLSVHLIPLSHLLRQSLDTIQSSPALQRQLRFLLHYASQCDRRSAHTYRPEVHFESFLASVIKAALSL
jgi:replication factor C subunit 3/5